MRTLTKATAALLKPVLVSKDDVLELSLTADGNSFIADIYQFVSWSPNGKSYPSAIASRTFVRRFPERKALDGICRWELAATDLAATVITSAWPTEQLRCSEEATTLLQYLTSTLESSNENAERVARYREHKTVPPHDVTLHPEFPLSPYQQVALVNSLKSEGYNLFMEQGTGKTPVVIARVCYEAHELREGVIDYKTTNRNRAKILAETEAALTTISVEVHDRLRDSLARKEKKLRDAATRRASKMHVRLEYEGTADALLQKAREAVRAAERWLSSRMAAIAVEMQCLRAAAEDEAAAEIARRQEQVRLAADAALARLEVVRLPGERRMYRAIVVCPNNVRLNWQREFEKFSTEAGKVTVIRGGHIERTRLLIDALTPEDDCLFTVLVVSYESFIRMWPSLSLIEWDLAVLDEGHYIKSSASQRYRYAVRLRDISRRRMLLTGTPITNTPLDLYTQFEFLGRGWSGFTSWKAFREFYGVFKVTGEGYEKLVGCQNLPFMQERLARQSFIIRKSEALPDLPDKVYDVYEVEMTREQTEVYDRVRTDLIAEIADDLEREDRNRAITVNNILTKLLRLAQITSGFVTYDPQFTDDGEVISSKEIARLDPNPKVEALVEILKEKGPNSKTIIWACWVQDIRTIAARLRLEKIDCVTFYGGTSEADRQEAERRFNYDPACKVFIGNPAAGGVGLNLLGYPPTDGAAYSTNCDHEVYFSQNWSPTARSQSEDRAHRRGTRKNVRITDLCVPETIDEEIRARVMRKICVALQVSDVREILQNVLKGAF